MPQQYLNPEGQDLVPYRALGLHLHVCLELGTSQSSVSASLSPPPSTGLTSQPFRSSPQVNLSAAQGWSWESLVQRHFDNFSSATTLVL